MRSAESLLAPILTATIPGRPARARSRTSAASAPPLLNPIRLMTAASSTSRNRRGLRLPACAKGVIDPTSVKPKPSPSSASGTSASLSNPAATPTGLGKESPANFTASGPSAVLAPRSGSAASARIASRCPISESSANSAGLIRLNSIAIARLGQHAAHVERIILPARS